MWSDPLCRHGNEKYPGGSSSGVVLVERVHARYLHGGDGRPGELMF